MNLDKLLAQLKAKVRDFSVEERILPDGTRIFIMQAALPEVPFGLNRHVWHVLVVEDDQTEVPRSEIEAILRRFWHLELDLGLGQETH